MVSRPGARSNVHALCGCRGRGRRFHAQSTEPVTLRPLGRVKHTACNRSPSCHHPVSPVASLSRIAARTAWILPVFFAGLFIHQAIVAYQLQATLTQGELAEAEVLEVHMENRVDVTYDYASLRVELEDGQVITKEKMSLPHSLIQLLENRETVPVRVRPGAAQEMVVADFGATQWRIAALNAAMALGAAIVFGIGIFYWNRYLRREGEPSERGVTEPDPDHPARQVVRKS